MNVTRLRRYWQCADQMARSTFGGEAMLTLCASNAKVGDDDFDHKPIQTGSGHTENPGQHHKGTANLPSVGFQRVCRDLEELGEAMQIKASRRHRIQRSGRRRRWQRYFEANGGYARARASRQSVLQGFPWGYVVPGLVDMHNGFGEVLQNRRWGKALRIDSRMAVLGVSIFMPTVGWHQLEIIVRVQRRPSSRQPAHHQRLPSRPA